MTHTADRRMELPNGLTAYGLTPAAVRLYPLISDYFDGSLRLHRGMTVLDVGANVGLFSLELLQRCGGEARVLAFEPAPALFASLERNLAELFPGAAARAYRVALGDRPRDALFYYRPLAPVLSSLERHGPIDERALAMSMTRTGAPAAYRHIHGPLVRLLPPRLSGSLLRFTLWLGQRRTVAVPCSVKTLSQVIREEEIDVVDLLKVDVEGAELDVLRGVDDEDWPRIRAVIAEVHDADGRVAAVRRLLEDHGFDHVEVHQDWLFQSTDIYMVSCERS